MVHDDCSTDASAKAYYGRGPLLEVKYDWPKISKWSGYGFSVLPAGNRKLTPLADRVSVSVSKQPMGVVKASCHVLRRLFETTEAEGVILLQDDILLKVEWYTQLLQIVNSWGNSNPLGVLAGVKLGKSFHKGHTQGAVSSGITAQCLYVSRRVYEQANFLKQPPNVTKRFDDLLRNSAAAAGLWVGVINPGICQHIGVTSLVRPGKRWSLNQRVVRIGLNVSPPYAMADKVKRFEAGVEL